MLTAIKGYYDNGRIILSEEAPTKKRTEVIITFLSDNSQVTKKDVRKLGLLKDKISVPENFNDLLDDLNDYI